MAQAPGSRTAAMWGGQQAAGARARGAAAGGSRMWQADAAPPAPVAAPACRCCCCCSELYCCRSPAAAAAATSVGAAAGQGGHDHPRGDHCVRGPQLHLRPQNAARVGCVRAGQMGHAAAWRPWAACGLACGTCAACRRHAWCMLRCFVLPLLLAHAPLLLLTRRAARWPSCWPCCCCTRVVTLALRLER